MRTIFRYVLGAVAVLAGGGVLAFAAGRHEARAAPVVVRYTIGTDRQARYTIGTDRQGCPAQPLRLVVAGDLHVSSGTTPPSAIVETVRRINALHPDYVVLVGDYLGHGWPRDPAAIHRALAPLAALRPRHGTAAILGNNDWEDGPDAIAGAMGAMGIHVLRNDAWVTADAAFLGIEEVTSNTANPVLVQERYAATLARTRRPPPPLEFWMAHNPVMVDRVATTGTILFTGHTHGGQMLPAITVPLGRVIVDAMRAIGLTSGWPAEDYVRGLYRIGGKQMLVTSGIGVSDVPLRIGVPPEIVEVDMAACADGRGSAVPTP